MNTARNHLSVPARASCNFDPTRSNEGQGLSLGEPLSQSTIARPAQARSSGSNYPSTGRYMHRMAEPAAKLYYTRMAKRRAGGGGILFALAFLSTWVGAAGEEGLLAHYSFDGNLSDASGNRNHAVATGMVGSTSDRAGRPNQAVTLGNGAFINLGNLYPAIADAYTMMLWIKSEQPLTKAINGTRRIVFITRRTGVDGVLPIPGKTGAGGWGTLGINEYGELAFMLDDIEYLKFSATAASVNVLDGKWHHVAGVKNGSDYHLYLDGVRRATLTDTRPITPSDNTRSVWVGRHVWQATTVGMVDDFQGAVDEVRLYGRALSEAEVRSRYERDAAPAAGSVSENRGRLGNLSVRATVGTGNGPLIVGFAVAGGASSAPQSLLARAVGPTLRSFGIVDVLPDPMLRVYEGARLMTANDNWDGGSGLAGLFARVGAFALGAASDDAAIALSMPPGSYTMQIADAGSASGVALAELYEADTSAGSSRLVNVSARSTVGNAGSILITGFVIVGPGPVTVLVRAIGPALAQFGVASPLADPMLSLYRDSTLIASNDDWHQPANAEAAIAAGAVGAFPLGATSRDSALLVTLQPGSYAAHATGRGAIMGEALVEVYEVP